MNCKVQLLIATMNQNDHSLLKRMNIDSDAIVANQCDLCSNEKFNYNDNNIIYLNRPEIGVGNNRNLALSYSNRDFLTFADDDMFFVNGYENIIINAFKELPKADGIIFNIETIGADMNRRINTKIKRIHFYNALNYGAARLSVRKTSIKRENITFHTCFGGGTIYSAGEDSLFICDMLKKGLRLYTYPVCIASVDQTSSTWFKGYTEKYFFDKGCFFRSLSKKWCYLLCLQDLIRHRKTYGTLKGAFQYMKKGIKAFSSLRTFQ